MRALLQKLYDAALRRRVAVCLALGLLLFLPSLRSGFYIDDLWHQALLDARARGLDRSDLLDFSLKFWSLHAPLPGPAYLQDGSPYALTWFADWDLEIRFFRPVSALTFLANHQILGATPFSFHIVNLGLWLALVAAVLELHRRLLPDKASRPALLLAGLFFVLDDAHVYDVIWIAARHGLLDVLLSMVSLLFYDRYRQHGGLHRILLSLAAFTLALGSGETGLVTIGWIAAYEIFLARDPKRDRLSAAAPFGALAVAYVVFYVAAGYGTRASSWYLDPFDRPLAYLQATFTRRIPGYLIGGLTAVPGELSQVASPLITVIGLALVAIVLAVVAPSVRRRPELRFAAAATLSSLPLLCIVPPFSYKLLFPSVAISLLLGVGVTDTIQRLRAPAPLPRARRAGLWIASGIVVIMHAAIPPVASVFLLQDFIGNTRIETRQAMWQAMDWPEDRENSDVYLINTPGTWTGLFLPTEDFYFTGRWVRSYIPVSFQGVTTDVTRLDSRTLRLRSKDGFLTGYFPQSLVALVRRDPRLRIGEDMNRNGYTVVVESAHDGVPDSLLVRFPRNLDDPHVWLLAFDGSRTRRVRAPRIGGTARLEVRRPRRP
ncbi:MAG TPA: hypothetical protein VH394_19720 [Thermoanaerobaculia bacterium]|jgi:hypothetical protein|nr:hypothetical protein [Thermoanaerobaculia bacterium]